MIANLQGNFAIRCYILWQARRDFLRGSPQRHQERREGHIKMEDGKLRSWEAQPIFSFSQLPIPPSSRVFLCALCVLAVKHYTIFSLILTLFLVTYLCVIYRRKKYETTGKEFYHREHGEKEF